MREGGRRDEGGREGGTRMEMKKDENEKETLRDKFSKNQCL